MRIAEIIGTVTLSQLHPNMEKARLRLATPLSTEEVLAGRSSGSGETLVVCDQLGAGEGDWIALAEGPEAAQPFRPQIIPLDAYNAAILDSLDVERP